MLTTPQAIDGVLEDLRALLGENGLLHEEADRARYEAGWRYGRGRALAVARPKTPSSVAAVLELCHRAGVRVQPMGANTGLVGASNPDASGEQLVLSLERLSSTIDVDPIGRTVLVDAGVTLSQLNQALEPHGLFFPIDLGADPQIGGMIATNTGGTRLLRYGAVREHVLGLEVALADGRLWTDLSPLRKDNRGLDLKQLFLGTSGTLGIVTRAVLSLAPLPKQTTTAWVALQSGEGALELLAHLERGVGETLSAFEVLSRNAFEATLRHGAGLTNPFGELSPEVAALIELSTPMGPQQMDLESVMLTSLEVFMTEREDLVLDVVPLKPQAAWHLRHQVSESLRHEGHVLALDVSVPRSQIARFTRDVREDLARHFPQVRMCDFGHWGDGGTHLNLVWDPAEVDQPRALTEELQTRIYGSSFRDYGGSFSAEHGVGPHNQDHYETLSSELLLSTCRALKEHFDPARRLGNVRLEGSSTAG